MKRLKIAAGMLAGLLVVGGCGSVREALRPGPVPESGPVFPTFPAFQPNLPPPVEPNVPPGFEPNVPPQAGQPVDDPFGAGGVVLTPPPPPETETAE